MRFACNVSRLGDGRWLVRHASPAAGTIETVAASRDEAIEKMRGEIRYRLELCPCTGETYQHIDVELAES
jgi:hypothetical protein